MLQLIRDIMKVKCYFSLGIYLLVSKTNAQAPKTPVLLGKNQTFTIAILIAFRCSVFGSEVVSKNRSNRIGKII